MKSFSFHSAPRVLISKMEALLEHFPLRTESPVSRGKLGDEGKSCLYMLRGTNAFLPALAPNPGAISAGSLNKRDILAAGRRRVLFNIKNQEQKDYDA